MGLHSRNWGEKTGDAAGSVQGLAKEGPRLSALGTGTGTSGRPRRTRHRNCVGEHFQNGPGEGGDLIFKDAKR